MRVFQVISSLFSFQSVFSTTPGRINHKGRDIFLNGINVPWGSWDNDVNVLDPSCTTSTCQNDRNWFENMISDVASHGGYIGYYVDLIDDISL
jgi:hypothetical protein